jgi:hypothetical protein
MNNSLRQTIIKTNDDTSINMQHALDIYKDEIKFIYEVNDATTPPAQLAGQRLNDKKHSIIPNAKLGKK